MPEFAHGRQVFFWLSNDAEVRGEFSGIKESEIEIKAGRHKDGGLIVEFEGPGKDVRSSTTATGAAVDTAGGAKPEKNDIKTYLLRVDVKAVMTTGTCQ